MILKRERAIAKRKSEEPYCTLYIINWLRGLSNPQQFFRPLLLPAVMLKAKECECRKDPSNSLQFPASADTIEEQYDGMEML
jgi:hypothetical protein